MSDDGVVRITIDAIVDDSDIQKLMHGLESGIKKAGATRLFAQEHDSVAFLTRAAGILKNLLQLKREAAQLDKSVASSMSQQFKQDLGYLRAKTAEINRYVTQHSRLARPINFQQLARAQSGADATEEKRSARIRLAQHNESAVLAARGLRFHYVERRTGDDGRKIAHVVHDKEAEERRAARFAPMHGPSSSEWARLQKAQISALKASTTQEKEASRIQRAVNTEKARESAAEQGKRVVMRTGSDGYRYAHIEDPRNNGFRGFFDARYFQHRFGGQVGQIFTQGVPSAIRNIVGGALSAAGGRVGLADALGDSVSLEKQAINLSNSSIVESDPKNKERVMPQKLVAFARDISNKTGFSASQVLSGLDANKALTGDLSGSLSVSEGVLRLAAINGVDPTQMMGLAGNIQTKVSDKYGADKANAVTSGIMSVLVQQSRIGGVEPVDFAHYSDQMLAMVPATSQDPIQAIKDLGALAQISRAFGGSGKGAQSFKAVAAMLQRLQTGAGAKQYSALTGGKSATDAQGRIRPAEEVVMEVLDASGGDPTKINKLFPGLVAKRGIGGLQNVYNDAKAAALSSTPTDVAGANRAGAEAARAALGRFDLGPGSKTVADESLALVTNSTSGKINELNNTVGRASDAFNLKFAEALDRAIPKIEGVAASLGTIAVSALEHPAQATAAMATGLVGASAANAVIGAMVSGTIATLGLATGTLALGTGAIGLGAVGLGGIAYNARKTLTDNANIDPSVSQIEQDAQNFDALKNDPEQLKILLDRAKVRADKISAVDTEAAIASYNPWSSRSQEELAATQETNNTAGQVNSNWQQLLVTTLQALLTEHKKGIKVDVTSGAPGSSGPKKYGQDGLSPIKDQ